MLNTATILILVFFSTAYADDAPLLEISNGLLQGTIEKSYNGKEFSSFEGVPYARPPVDDLRFEVPIEPYNWTGTWVANTKHLCIQSFVGVNPVGVSGDEDCLYLNVYVPRTKPSSSDNLPVIVHIHGGSFMLGSGHFYAGPQYLMDEEVIFVTINYRLGPFGFLSTEDKIIPGNNGLKDQVQALKWIQKNIKYFGGNPNSVTLTGMSAGGASVHFHYFSSLSKGLFHRGVSSSGTVLNPWTFQEAALDKAKRLAVLVGCPADNSKEILQCLKSRSAYKIAETVNNFYGFNGLPFSPFGPVVEEDDKGAFLKEHPYKMLIEKNVADLPWITSVTKDEGVFPAATFSKLMTEVNQNFDKVAPHILDFNYTVEDRQKISTINKIKQHYFKESVTFEDIIKLCGDRHFYSGAGLATKLQAKANKSPVYFYVMAFRGESSFSVLFLGAADDIGVSHGDDIQYYLRTPLAREILSQSDENMKSTFMQWMLSFVENNEPKIDGSSWEPVTGDKLLNGLYIEDSQNIHMKKMEDFGSLSFWSKIPLKENDYYIVTKDEL